MHRIAARTQPALQQFYLGRFARPVDPLDRDQPAGIRMGRAEQRAPMAVYRPPRATARLGRTVARLGRTVARCVWRLTVT